MLSLAVVDADGCCWMLEFALTRLLEVGFSFFFLFSLCVCVCIGVGLEYVHTSRAEVGCVLMMLVIS